MTKSYSEYQSQSHDHLERLQREGGNWQETRARPGGDDQPFLTAWTDGSIVAFPEGDMDELCERLNDAFAAGMCGSASGLGGAWLLGDPAKATDYLGPVAKDSYVVRWDWVTGDASPARVAPRLELWRPIGRRTYGIYPALTLVEAEIEGEESRPAPQPPLPGVSAVDLETLNAHRKHLGMAPIDLGAGWTEGELREMAESIRATGRMHNPRSRRGYPSMHHSKGADWPSNEWSWTNDVNGAAPTENARVTIEYSPPGGHWRGWKGRYSVRVVVGLRKSHEEWMRTRSPDYYRYPGGQRVRYDDARDNTATTAGEAQAIATQLLMEVGHMTFNAAVSVTAPFNKYDYIDFPPLGPTPERHAPLGLYRNPATLKGRLMR